MSVYAGYMQMGPVAPSLGTALLHAPLVIDTLPPLVRLRGGRPAHALLQRDTKHSTAPEQSAASSPGVLGAVRTKWDHVGRAAQRNQILSVLVAAAAFLAMNYAFFGLFSAANFIAEPKARMNFAACIVSCVHASVVSLLAYDELCIRGWRLLGSPPLSYLSGQSHDAGWDISSACTPTGVATLIFCSGYMLQDIGLLYFWHPEQTLYIYHHWAVLLYIFAALFSGVGDLSACLCIFLGEITAPINNVILMSDLLHQLHGTQVIYSERERVERALTVWSIARAGRSF